MIRRLVTLAAASCLLAAVPSHVMTADYFGGYAGTHLVSAGNAARWLTWAETNIAGSQALLPLGVKTLLYTDPYRTMAGDPDLPPNGAGFAKDCGGARIEANRAGQFLMDPHDPAVLSQWKSHVQRYSAEGRFTAIFVDDAANLAYVKGVPCNVKDWLVASNAMQRSLGYPLVYNGLSIVNDSGPSPAIALNDSAIGGMMEECYARSPAEPKVGGAAWRAQEATEMQMASARKLFFCYGNDTSPAASSLDGRLYAYASFLLSYDAATGVLWEYYASPSRLHVMPETQLVPADPVRAARTPGDLATASGVFVRAYRACYLAGQNQGPCTIAVNSDRSPHGLALDGMRRTLALSGAALPDGGTARVVAQPPPAQLAPLQAVIAFR